MSLVGFLESKNNEGNKSSLCRHTARPHTHFLRMALNWVYFISCWSTQTSTKGTRWHRYHLILKGSWKERESHQRFLRTGGRQRWSHPEQRSFCRSITLPQPYFWIVGLSPFLPSTNGYRIVILVTFPACCWKNDVQRPWKAACRMRVSFLWSQIHFKKNSDLPGKLTPNCVITARTWNSRRIHLMLPISSHGGTNGLPERWLLTSVSDAHCDLC